MSDQKTVDPEARYGDVSETWGNLPLPDGALATYEEFRFKDAPDDGPSFKVKRVLPFPLDAGKRLYFYEALSR